MGRGLRLRISENGAWTWLPGFWLWICVHGGCAALLCQVLQLEEKIRKYWNLKTFLAGDANHKKWRRQSQFEGDADEDGVGGKDVWLDTDAAIADQMTWIGINVVYDIGLECEHIGRWAEACGCPEHQPHSDSIVSASHGAQTSKHQPNPKAGQAKTSARSKRACRLTARGFNQELCPYRGCRAPELAAGLAMKGQLGLLMSNRAEILRHIGRVPLQPSAQTDLLNDWHVGRSRLWSSSETIVLARFCCTSVSCPAIPACKL